MDGLQKRGPRRFISCQTFYVQFVGHVDRFFVLVVNKGNTGTVPISPLNQITVFHIILQPILMPTP
jgi:hypothetical protein